MVTYCKVCGVELPEQSYRGPPRLFCSGKCRKSQYAQPCIDCGRLTSHGSEGRKVQEPRCTRCTANHRKVWTKERIIEAIREWDALYGDPPAGPDWNQYHARSLGDTERAERFENANGRWPSSTSVIHGFGSWNAAIEAAGFDPRPAHGGGGNARPRRKLGGDAGCV